MGFRQQDAKLKDRGRRVQGLCLGLHKFIVKHMDKKTKKERIEKAKKLIDSTLSMGKMLSNIELYEILESEFHILGFGASNSDASCLNASELSVRNYRLSLEYSPILKEIIRWIKQQIVNQGKQLSEYFESEVYPQDKRRSIYRYKKKGYTVYGNEISAKLFSKMDAVIRAMEDNETWSKHYSSNKTDSEKITVSISHPTSLACIDHSIQERIDKMLRLKEQQLHNVFLENLNYFIYCLNEGLDDDIFHSELKTHLDESRKMFDKNDLFSMLVLYLAVKCQAYTRDERATFGKEWFSREWQANDFDEDDADYDEASDSATYEWLIKYMCLDITKTIVVLFKDENKAKESIERCISFIESLNKLDDDDKDNELSERYSNLCALYILNYIKIGEDEEDASKKAVSFGERFIEWVNIHNIKGNPSIANVLYTLSVQYDSNFYGYDGLKAEFYIKKAIAMMEALQSSELKDKEQLSDCFLHLADIYSHYSQSLKYPELFRNSGIITDIAKVSTENIQLLKDKAQQALI